MPTEEIELSNNFDNVSTVNNNKSAFYERKRQSKAIRVLIVLAYVLSVSLAAIILSAYYVFVWDGKPKLSYQTCEQGEMDHGRADDPHHNRTNIVIPDFVRYRKITSESRILDVLVPSNNFQKSTTTPVKHTSGIIASQNNNISKEVIRPTTAYEDTTYVTTPQEENSTWLPDLENDFEGDYNDFKTEPIFIKKLFGYRKVKVK